MLDGWLLMIFYGYTLITAKYKLGVKKSISLPPSLLYSICLLTNPVNPLAGQTWSIWFGDTLQEVIYPIMQ